MEEVMKWLVEQADLLSGFLKAAGIIISAIAAFRKWVLKPVLDLIKKNEESVTALQNDYIKKRDEVFDKVEELRLEIVKNDQKSEERHGKLRDKFEDMRKEMSTVQDDVADVLGNELEIGHHKFMTQGWCSSAEKQHYVDMHKRYSERGHNHLAQHYEEDLLDLPEYPPETVG